MAENQQNRDNYFIKSGGKVRLCAALIFQCWVKLLGVSPSFPVLGNSLTLLGDRSVQSGENHAASQIQWLEQSSGSLISVFNQ